jgi:hypothetical protein
MGFLDDMVAMPNQTAVLDNGTVDYITQIGPDGLAVQRPLAATEEEKRQAYRAALRRELEGVEHRLEHLDDPAPWWTAAPTAEQIEQDRTSLENTRAVILAELDT